MGRQLTKQNNILANEHVFIAGRTGTGKTWLARKYLAGNFKNVVVLDTKGTFTWPEVPAEDQTLVERLTKIDAVTTPKIIYRPAWEELNMDYYNEFFRWAYRRRNTIVLVDEAMSICPNPQVIPEYLKAIMTRGRELGVAAWNASQRPSGLPQVLISEATHIFCFDLNLAADRDKIAKITGYDDFYIKPSHRTGADRYSFYYFRADVDSPPVVAKIVESQAERQVKT